MRGENSARYQLLFLMQPRDEKLFHDLNMTAQAARVKAKVEIELGLLNERDANYIAQLFSQAQPFYAAAD